MTEILSTRRLILRTWSPADAAVVLELWGNPVITNFLGDAPPLPDLNSAHEKILSLDRSQATHGFCRWAMVTRDTHQVVGACGFSYIDDEIGQDPFVDIGYCTMMSWWGRGLATEAVVACVRYGFAVLRLPKVLALIHNDNTASTRVAEKSHLTYVGLDPISGERRYEAHSDEWNDPSRRNDSANHRTKPSAMRQL